ncbi:MAG: hypothetical protein WBX25_03270 [Rhodomicrobium sp.]
MSPVFYVIPIFCVSVLFLVMMDYLETKVHLLEFAYGLVIGVGTAFVSFGLTSALIWPVEQPPPVASVENAPFYSSYIPAEAYVSQAYFPGASSSAPFVTPAHFGATRLFFAGTMGAPQAALPELGFSVAPRPLPVRRLSLRIPWLP